MDDEPPTLGNLFRSARNAMWWMFALVAVVQVLESTGTLDRLPGWALGILGAAIFLSLARLLEWTIETYEWISRLPSENDRREE